MVLGEKFLKCVCKRFVSLSGIATKPSNGAAWTPDKTLTKP